MWWHQKPDEFRSDENFNNQVEDSAPLSMTKLWTMLGRL